jgi:DNA polymerase I-like protein with 3'-5' exonuclease and polymerase domains
VTVAIDVESTGLDLRHGAKVFFVTTCRPNGEQVFYEWPVDPYTREVAVPPEDVAELNALLASGEELVGHNVKFDATALAAVGVGPWPWDRTHDTTLLAHLLASNQPKDLTALATLWLGRDILPLEVRLGEAVKKARSLVKRKDFLERFGAWDVTHSDLDDPRLPSGGGWRTEYWLPKALHDTGYFADEGLTDGWDRVLRDYANEDSAITACLYETMLRKVRERGLEKFYEERRKLLRVCWEMEKHGLTVSTERRQLMEAKLIAERDEEAEKCHAIARKYKYELEFPKGASPNNNLRTFCFDVLGLPPIVNPKAKTNAPSLDAKTAIPYYLTELPEDSDGGKFILALAMKRSRDTGLTFLRTWDDYGHRIEGVTSHTVIRADFNPTGTVATRLSCKNPNAQQIGKKDRDAAGLPIAVLRGVFGPAPGREWWSLDFANIELRIPAYLSGERDLIDLFERADEPPFYGSEHLLNFSVVYPDLWEDAVRKVGIDKVGPWVKKEYAGSWYKDCKNGDFAVQYQAGDATADRTFKRPGSRRRLKERFAKKEQTVAEALRFAERHGYIETLPDRTVDPTRGYPLWTQRTEYGKVMPTLPYSYKIQGTAGWIGNRAGVRCLDQLDEWNRVKNDWWLVCYVHDEFVFDFPKRAHPKADPKKSNLGRVRVLQRLMEQGGGDLVPVIPIRAAVEYHETSWAEGVAL